MAGTVEALQVPHAHTEQAFLYVANGFACGPSEFADDGGLAMDSATPDPRAPLANCLCLRPTPLAPPSDLSRRLAFFEPLGLGARSPNLRRGPTDGIADGSSVSAAKCRAWRSLSESPINAVDTSALVGTSREGVEPVVRREVFSTAVPARTTGAVFRMGLTGIRTAALSAVPADSLPEGGATTGFAATPTQFVDSSEVFLDLEAFASVIRDATPPLNKRPCGARS